MRPVPTCQQVPLPRHANNSSIIRERERERDKRNTRYERERESMERTLSGAVESGQIVLIDLDRGPRVSESDHSPLSGISNNAQRFSWGQCKAIMESCCRHIFIIINKCLYIYILCIYNQLNIYQSYYVGRQLSE